MDRDISLEVDGARRSLAVDTRTSLLDAMRERLGATSAKKGCDHGQCGACTVLLDGRRVNSCLVLAVTADGAQVTTSDGLAGETPHRLHETFVDHDAYQCGYCTPGQVVSAAAVLDEAARGWPSAVTEDLVAERTELTDAEIRERMSGNLCRCAAYANIVPAIAQVSAEINAAEVAVEQGVRA